MARTWARVAEEVRAGRQAYVVCPRIGDDDVPDEDTDLRAEPVSDDGEEAAAPARPLKSVYAVHAALAEEPALAGLSVEVLHGRLTSEEKDAVMGRFQRGELDVLVSTTVVEVGVDVPNASVMVVMDADRFGVSQLHQLRGRIGRGGHPGLCLLVTGTDAEPAMTRLDAVAATTDGFELARLDLSQRREGDILGAAQHGRRTQLEFLHILDDEEVIEEARDDAFALVADDPELAEHPAPRRGRARPGRRRAGRLPGARLMTRIIAGVAGGRTVRTPPGSGTRPTSDRVREAVFSALDARDAVHGSRVLDLYAGSGALGLEAASRGAASVVLVESDRRAADVIAGNARDLGLPRRARRAHHRRGPPRARSPRREAAADLVFVDPPYDLDEPALRLVLDRLAAGWLAPGGLARRRALHPQPRTTLARHHPPGHGKPKKYGETTVWYADPRLTDAGSARKPRQCTGRCRRIADLTAITRHVRRFRRSAARP